jgi:hypothetical protein
VNPLGDPGRPPQEERELREALVTRALEALGEPVAEPTVME